VNLTYNDSPLAPTSVGSYSVSGTIVDPSYYGSATNTLVIGLPAQNFTIGNGGLIRDANGIQLPLQLTGTPGYPYVLQTTTNLSPPINWQTVFTNIADTNGNCVFLVTNLMGFPAGYYRAVSR
jgi:hypothetical protein